MAAKFFLGLFTVVMILIISFVGIMTTFYILKDDMDTKGVNDNERQ